MNNFVAPVNQTDAIYFSPDTCTAKGFLTELINNTTNYKRKVYMVSTFCSFYQYYNL